MHGLLLIKGSHPALPHTDALNLQGSGGPLLQRVPPHMVHVMGVGGRSGQAIMGGMGLGVFRA